MVNTTYDLGSEFLKIASRKPLPIPAGEIGVMDGKRLEKTIKDFFGSPVYLAAVPSVALKLTNVAQQKLHGKEGKEHYFGTEANKIISAIKDKDGNIREGDGVGGWLIRSGRVVDETLFGVAFSHMLSYCGEQGQTAYFAVPPEEMASIYEWEEAKRQTELSPSAKILQDSIHRAVDSGKLKDHSVVSQGSGAAASEGFGVDTEEESMVLSVGGGTTDGQYVHKSVPTYCPRTHIYAYKRNKLTNFACAEMMADLRVKLNSLNRSESTYVIEFGDDDSRWIFHEFGAVAMEHCPKALQTFEYVDTTNMPHALDIRQPVVDACSPIIPALAECFINLFGCANSQLARRNVRKNVLLSGGGANLAGIAPTLEAMLKEQGREIKVKTLNEPTFGTALGTLRLLEKLG